MGVNRSREPTPTLATVAKGRDAVRLDRIFAAAAAAFVSVCPSAAHPKASAPQRPLSASLTCADASTAVRFAAYQALVASEPERYPAELATLRQLQRSDVEYVVEI